MLLTQAWPGLTHATILGHPERELPEETASAFDALAARRLAGEPIATCWDRANSTAGISG